jgi:environmental stress-induced protein Ves
VQTPKLRVIRRTSFKATPWKNGGGITHEAIREPEGDPFRWRVSVAQIDASGPFSEFTGYDRKMVLLQGAGIDLHFGDGTHRALRNVGELVEFDGALAAHCDLLSGPCVDLNLMVSKSDGAAVRVERLMESVALRASGDETVLVFPIDRGVTLTINTGMTETLEPWDLALLSQCSGHLSRLESPHSSASTSVFVARLIFVSGEQQAGFGVGDSVDQANTP